MLICLFQLNQKFDWFSVHEEPVGKLWSIKAQDKGLYFYFCEF